MIDAVRCFTCLDGPASTFSCWTNWTSLGAQGRSGWQVGDACTPHTASLSLTHQRNGSHLWDRLLLGAVPWVPVPSGSLHVSHCQAATLHAGLADPGPGGSTGGDGSPATYTGATKPDVHLACRCPRLPIVVSVDGQWRGWCLWRRIVPSLACLR